MQPETKVCQSCKQSFLIEPEDFEFYEKIKVPPPTFCPECRNIQRLATRNMKSLYRRNCDKCDKNIISRFSQHNPAVMYCHDCWWKGDWDPLSYGFDYNKQYSFFEQFKKLLYSVPHVSILSSNMIRSDYANMEADDKDSYLTFGGHFNENCAYSVYSLSGKEVYDSYWSLHCEQCFGNTNVNRCYRTFFSEQCGNCIDTIASRDCRGCTNIIGCAGLRNKQYCIFNEELSKDEFESRKATMNLGSRVELDSLLRKSKEVWGKVPHLYAEIIKSVGCSGDNIMNSKNSRDAWTLEEGEDCKHICIAAKLKDCYDITSTANDELGYMNANGGGLYNCKAVLYSFSNDTFGKKNCYNSEYSYALQNCRDCFGCVGLRNKQNCILNKQYSEEEYKQKVEEIKRDMAERPYTSPLNGYTYSYGDFFPAEYSLFAYNETMAQDFYPQTKEGAGRQGFVWREEQENIYQPTGYVVPDNIKDVSDDILDAILQCAHTGKAYKITKMELEFYRANNLPIPLVAPLVRIQERMNDLLPFKLYSRSCAKCGGTLETPYAPDRPEIIYCEQCYQQEVV